MVLVSKSDKIQFTPTTSLAAASAEIVTCNKSMDKIGQKRALLSTKKIGEGTSHLFRATSFSLEPDAKI